MQNPTTCPSDMSGRFAQPPYTNHEFIAAARKAIQYDDGPAASRFSPRRRNVIAMKSDRQVRPPARLSARPFARRSRFGRRYDGDRSTIYDGLASPPSLPLASSSSERGRSVGRLDRSTFGSHLESNKSVVQTARMNTFS